MEKEARAKRIQQMLTALQEAVSIEEPETEVTAKAMFGGSGYYANGILFAMWYGEGLAFKLEAADREELMKIPGAAQSYNPSNIEVPEAFLEDAGLLQPWVVRSIRYARTQKASPRKRKKE